MVFTFEKEKKNRYETSISIISLPLSVPKRFEVMQHRTRGGKPLKTAAKVSGFPIRVHEVPTKIGSECVGRVQFATWYFPRLAMLTITPKKQPRPYISCTRQNPILWSHRLGPFRRLSVLEKSTFTFDRKRGALSER